MTSSRSITFIISHLVILGLAYGTARNLKPVAETKLKAAPVRTRSSNRTEVTNSGDGPELLAVFRKDFSQKKSRYEELKESLTPAADLKSAAISAIWEWQNETPEQDRVEAFAMMEARFFQWLRVNPREAMQYLGTEEKGIAAMKQRELISILGLHVLPDAIRERGLLKSLDWLTTHPAGIGPLKSVLLEEMKSGGGFALFLKVEEFLSKSSLAGMDLGAGFNGQDLLRNMGASVKFTEKDRLLDYVLLQSDETRGMNLLLGFTRTSGAAAAWTLGMIESGRIPETFASRLKGGIGNGVLNQPELDIDARIAARRFTPGNEKKTRDAIVGELVSNDVNRLLNEGRDWRFEFRHGNASLDEILAEVNGALKVPDEGKTDALITLYRNLSEENPEKALPLLDSLPEERRRAILFSNTWQSYGNINPDDFIAFVNKLPAPVTEKEKQDRLKGWDWKVRGSLMRYGDDYIEWVAALPSNPDKYAAINSIIWATREQNPEKAAKLNQRFYPKKP